ncbi:MAG: acyltransferase [Pyrinomonadaceae bacterium]
MDNAANINTHAGEHGVTLDLLDFCKGLAILWVMLVHARHRWFGWQGVHIFVVLSGFTLTYACRIKNTTTWKAWYLRRAERILPTYWLVAIIGFLLVLILGMVAPQENYPLIFSQQVWRLFADLSFLRNFFYKTMLADPNSALWFIGLTVGFYLAFPFLYKTLSKSESARSILLFVCALSLIEFIYRAVAVYFLDGAPVGFGHGFMKSAGRPPSAMQEINQNFPFQLWAPFGIFISRIGEYAVGMAAAIWLTDDAGKFNRLLFNPWSFLAGLAVWLGGNALVYAGRWGWIIADWVIAVGLMVWVINLARAVRRFVPPLFRQMSKLGVWSYYLFLTHLLVGYTAARLYKLWSHSIATALLMVLIALASIVAACLLLRRFDGSKWPKIIVGRSVGAFLKS